MNKHILIFFAFNNVEHIKMSFESIYCADIDYFIVENKSIHSEEIKNYFLKQKNEKDNIVGYIQFEKNIVVNALNIFIRKYIDILKKYEYITITDGDIYVYDIKSTMQEILMAFNNPDCVMSSVDLYVSNSYKTKNRIIGVDHYINFMKNNNAEFNNIVGDGVAALMTLQKKDIAIIENIHFLDSYIRERVREMGKLWLITAKNLAYHLTWDLYVDGNEYYEWKKNVYTTIWYQTEESNYINMF